MVSPAWFEHRFYRGPNSVVGPAPKALEQQDRIFFPDALPWLHMRRSADTLPWAAWQPDQCQP
jgi:hypothetical protein